MPFYIKEEENDILSLFAECRNKVLLQKKHKLEIVRQK